MIIKKEIKNGVKILYVKKDRSDAEMEKIKNKYVKAGMIKDIITDDTDAYDADTNKLLLKFRKDKLPKKEIDEFYDNVISFAKKSYSTNRGSASGSDNKNVWDNPKVYSNIIGYMDSFSPKQKYLARLKNHSLKYNARECRFNADYPEKYKHLIPLVQKIDHYYKLLTPEYYKKQFKKANQTHFRIPKTAFTTITTNVNFQTSIHKDKGDDEEGFGNLTVIEDGSYTGAETCFPQYGIGIDVRRGDVLFMDVHQWHGNLPMKAANKDVIRLSIVCYLRYNVWKNTKNITKKQMIKHNITVKNIKGKGVAPP
jgi:hypothetical protein